VNDENIAGSVLNDGNPICIALSEEREPIARDVLLAIPTLTIPQSKSPPPFSCHRTWGMSRGRGVRREGLEKATLYTFFIHHIKQKSEQN